MDKEKRGLKCRSIRKCYYPSDNNHLDCGSNYIISQEILAWESAKKKYPIFLQNYDLTSSSDGNTVYPKTGGDFNMTDADQKKLEDLQWKAGNHQATAEDNQEIDRLTDQLLKERGEPNGRDNGPVDPKKDSEDNTDKESDKNEVNNTNALGKGVTTTKNVHG